MKKKRPLDQEIYLPEYLSGTVARSFKKKWTREYCTGISGKLLMKRLRCR